MKIAGYAAIAALLALPGRVMSQPTGPTGPVVPVSLSADAKGKIVRLDSACLGCTPAAVSFTIDTRPAACKRFTFQGGGADDVKAAYAMLLTAANAGKAVAFKASWLPAGAGIAEGTLGSKTHCKVDELRLE